MYSFVDVHKRYGLKTVALRRINLQINEREFFVLYGPAGAGKSTMLNLLAGITRPTSGDVRRDGQTIVPLPPERRNAAMAFENYALYSHLSVAENLAFPLRAQKMSKTEATDRVREIAKVLGITPLLERRPGFLSGGQRQRVALGRAIIRPADIYLLDEPVGHLDAKLRHRMRAELKALAEELDATVVFTTTSSREALALGDRIGVINHGKLEQVGTPAELYRNPDNAFVASFIGDPPMSFISVAARRSGDRASLYTEGDHFVGDVVMPPIDTDNLQIGIRANALRLVDHDKADAVPARIQVVEHLGHSNIAVVQVGQDQVSVSLPPDQHPKEGDQVGLEIIDRGFRLFQGETAVSAEVV